MESLRYGGWFFLMLLLTGCSSAPSRPTLTEIPLPPERVVRDSFSLLPLNEQGWLVALQSSNTLALGKRGSVLDENRVIRVFVKPMPIDQDFSAFAESAVKMEGAKRYEVLKHETQKVESQGKDCVKIRDTLKDFEARKATKNPDPMILDMLYWVCKHPNRKNAVIVGYSDRFYEGHEDSAFEEKAETIFNGFTLIAR